MQSFSTSPLTRLLLLTALCLVGPLQTIRAAFTVTGNVLPSVDPALWTTATSACVGYTSNGALTVNSNSHLISGSGCIGDGSGTTGTVTISGLGSTWTNSEDLYVGYSGSGTLDIINGGAVSSNLVCWIACNSGSTARSMSMAPAQLGPTPRNSMSAAPTGHATLDITNGGTVNSGDCFIGNPSCSTGTATVDGNGSTWNNSYDLYVGGYYGAGTLNITNNSRISVGGTTWMLPAGIITGAINFGTNGGTLTTGSLVASPSEVTGTGTIIAHGLVTDVDLLFNSTASLKQTLTFNSLPSQNVKISLDMASDPSGNGGSGAGYQGNGSLTIQDGTAVNSIAGYIGYKAGSTGVVTVDGVGSTWATSGLYVGNSGNGTLNINHGGFVSNSVGENPA